MNHERKIKLVFLLHSIIAVFSHIFIVLIIGGLIQLFMGFTPLTFWEKGLLLGITFYVGMWGTNHLTNSESFCVLTDLENYYRAQAGLPKAGPFMQRFYARIFRRN